MTSSASPDGSSGPSASGPGQTVEEVGLIHKIGYALGGGGWVTVDRLLLTFGLYCYRPPGDSPLPQRLPEYAFLGLLSIWGLASLLGRVLDSITDPLMAAWTDRNRHPFGRRRIFMAWAVVPLCLFTYLVFAPPDDAPTARNGGWVFFTLFGFFLSYTVYAVPYTALLAELGGTPHVRLQLSVGQAYAQMGAAAVVMMGAWQFFPLFPEGDPRVFNAIGLAFALFGFLLMLGPIVLIPEPRLCDPGPVSHDSAFTSLFSTLQSRQLRWFLLATVSYWFGFNVVAQGAPYYVTVLMGKPESFGTLILGTLFASSGLFFPVLFPLARRFGKRRMMIAGALGLAGLLFLLPFVRDWVAGLVFMGLAGIPVAVVMAVPNPMLAALADDDARRSGVKRQAMVFATQAFFLKVNLGVSTAVVAGLLPLGDTVDNPLGVQLTGPAAGLILLVSAFAYWRFEEAPAEPPPTSTTA